MIFIETKGQFLMKVTKSAVGTAVVWCIFCNCFLTGISIDVIFVDAQKMEAKEKDLQYREITFKHNYLIVLERSIYKHFFKSCLY